MEHLVSQSKPGALEKNFLPVLVKNSLTRIGDLKTLSIPVAIFKTWHEQIEKDLATGVIVSVKNGFEKLLSERAYGGLDYAVFLEGAKKDTSAEAVEQLVICLSPDSRIRQTMNEKTKNILKQFGGVRYLSELQIADIPRFRKDFLNSYINYLD